MADGKITKKELVEQGAASAYKDLETQAVASFEAITLSIDKLVKKQNELGVSFKDLVSIDTQLINKTKELDAATRKLEQAKKAREAQVNKESALNERLAKQRLQEQKDAVRSEQLLNKLAKANQNNANAYTRLNAELKKVETQYKNLSAKQAQGIALSVKEQGQLKALTTKLAMLSGAYKKVDADMVRTTGGVRRASSSFDSLGFSVAQITRESPAFINSMNTGFMAISNNIPIFVDEINKLKRANAELIAQGKPQVSVLKKVGAAFFSWQSLISVSIVLLTIFGPKLIKMAQAAIKGAKGVDILKEAQKALNEVEKEGIKNAGKQLTNLSLLSKAVKDTSRSEKERNEILEAIRKEYGNDIKHLTDREILTNGLAAAEDLLKKRIIERATADAAASKISENVGKIIDLELERETIIKTTIASQKRLAEANNVSSSSQTQYGSSISTSAQAQRDFNLSQDRLVENSKELNLLYGVNNKLTEVALKNIDSLISTYSSGGKEVIKFMEGSIGWLEQQISKNNTIIKQATDNSTRTKYREENVLLQEQLDKLTKIKVKVENIQTTLAQEDIEIKVPIGVEVDEEKFRASFEEIMDLAAQFNDAIGGLFDAISDRRLEAIDAEIEAEEKKYDRLIELAKDDAAQKEVLERNRDELLASLEKKRLKEEQKAAKQRKAFALVDVAINTAVQISKVLANPFLVAAVATLGAIQAATVLAQPIPQFAEGGTMGWDGKALINDGGNREFVERNGQIFSSPIKNAVVDLQKGDIIHKDMDALMNASIMTSLANDNKNLDSSKLKLIFDNNYAGLEKTIKNGFNNANVNTNVKLNGFDHAHQAYKESQSRWS